MTRHLHKISKYTPSLLQGTLEFEVGRPRAGLAREHTLERHTIPALSIVLTVLVVAYLYFVASSILNVMGGSEAERAERGIEGSMGALEQQYLTLSQSVSPEVGGTIGLAPVEATSYVYRPIDTAMVDFSRNQI